MVARVGDVFHEKQIGARELALAMHGRHHHGRERQRVQLLDDVYHVASERALPPSRNDATIAHIGGDHELAGKERGHGIDPPRLLDRARPYDHAVGTQGEQPLDVVPTPYTAPDLNTRLAVAQQLGDHLLIRPSSRCRIEIDEVETCETDLRPTARDAKRILEAQTLVIVRAAHELDASASAQVHGGNGDHAPASRTSARRNATPARELFSGWNCTPTAFPSRTIAGNRSVSCTLHARTTSDRAGLHANPLA